MFSHFEGARHAFRDYEHWLRRTVDTYRDFVRGWYKPEFAEVMMHPSDKFELRQARLADRRDETALGG